MSARKSGSGDALLTSGMGGGIVLCCVVIAVFAAAAAFLLDAGVVGLERTAFMSYVSLLLAGAAVGIRTGRRFQDHVLIRALLPVLAVSALRTILCTAGKGTATGAVAGGACLLGGAVIGALTGVRGKMTKRNRRRIAGVYKR